MLKQFTFLYVSLFIFIKFWFQIKIQLPENPEFSDGYRTWNKNKVFEFGSRHQVFVGGCKISPFGAS